MTAPRPRIWLDPPTLTRMKGLVYHDDDRWRVVRDRCAAELKTSPLLPSSGPHAIQFAFAYAVSGNAIYAARAITLAQREIDQGLAAMTREGPKGYSVRDVLPKVALVYDWCYDQIPLATRALWAVQMEDWCDWVWPETNPARAGAWAVSNPGSNYYLQGFMMTWLVGLVLQGESARADGYVTQAQRRWSQEILHYLNTTGAGGYLLEGTNYGTGSIGRLFWLLSTGIGPTWPQFALDAIICRLHATTPDLRGVLPWGDQSGPLVARPTDYDRETMLLAMSYLPQPYSGYARSYLDRVHPTAGGTFKFLLWQTMLWYRPDVPARDYTQELPTGYRAAGAGLVISRSDWTPQATLFSCICGPDMEGHQDRGNGSWVLWKGGDWLVSLPKLTGNPLWSGSEYHNDLLVDGEGQPLPEPSIYESKRAPEIGGYEDTAALLRIWSWLGEAYSVDGVRPPVPVLAEWRREWIWLKQAGILLLIDDVAPVDAAAAITWLLQCKAEPVLTGTSYLTSTGTLLGRILSPEGVTLSKVPITNKAGAVVAWRIEALCPAGDAQIINLLQF